MVCAAPRPRSRGVPGAGRLRPTRTPQPAIKGNTQQHSRFLANVKKDPQATNYVTASSIDFEVDSDASLFTSRVPREAWRSNVQS